MQPFTLVFVTLTLSVAAPAFAAGEIHVPGDFPDPQSAINAALPGDLVVVHGGAWDAITIDKPMHLLGNPAPLFKGTLVGTSSYYYGPPITLTGPGSGVVTLSNITTGGSVGGIASWIGPGVSAGGFDELHIYDSVLRGNKWTATTDPAEGAPGLTTSIPFVMIARSTVEASASIGSSPTAPGGAETVPGISAPSSTVVVLDSTVHGGTGGPFYLWDGWGPCGSCSGCTTLGVGAPGIVCDTLHHAGSVILGGKGADWFDAWGTHCTTLSDGPPIVAATEVSLANNLFGSGPMKLGSTYGLTWSTPGPLTWLFFSPGIGFPLQISGLGFGYLDIGSVVQLGAFPAPGSVNFGIPALPVLLGKEVALQAFDPAVGATRPVIGTLQP
jgi:hypothetical protein